MGTSSREQRRRRERGDAGGGAEVPPGSGWAGSPRVVLALSLGLTLFFALALFEPKIHTGGDSAHYVLLGESLLRTGDGYADSYEPGPPVPHTKYPPGLPAMLAPLLAVFGRNVVVLKLLSVALTVGSVAVFFLYARRTLGPSLWMPATLAFAVSPVAIDYSHWILSEAPFLFFTLLALLFLEREREEEELGRWFWLSIVAMAAAYWVRSIGVVFLVAGTLYYLATRRWRRFIWFNVVGAGLTLPWFIRGQVLGGSATPYIEQFLLKSVYEPEAGYHDLAGMVGRLFTNVGIYSVREMPRVLAGSESAWALAPALKALALVLCVAMVAGWVRRLRERPGVAEVYFALSWLALLLFEEVVSDVRYLMPLVPLVLVYVCDGLAWGGRKALSARSAHVPAVAAMVVVTMVGVLAQLQRVPQNLQMLRVYAAGDRYAGYHPAWRSFFTASDWIGENTPPDAVITVRKPRLVHLWTDRNVLLYPFSTDPDSVLSVVDRTDYVMVDQISATTGRYLVPALTRDPQRFQVVARTPEPVTYVLRVRAPEDGRGAADAPGGGGAGQSSAADSSPGGPPSSP